MLLLVSGLISLPSNLPTPLRSPCIWNMSQSVSEYEGVKALTMFAVCRYTKPLQISVLYKRVSSLVRLTSEKAKCKVGEPFGNGLPLGAF